MFTGLSPRLCFFLGFAGCAGLLAAGGYLQYAEQLEPCPLCISQRLVFMATGILFLIAAIHIRRRKFYAILLSLTALLGTGISARHVWIQNLPPDQVPECGPGLEYVFKHFPLADTLKLMLTGTEECAKIEWTLLGLSIPAWALIAFILMAGFSVLQFFNKGKQ